MRSSSAKAARGAEAERIANRAKDFYGKGKSYGARKQGGLRAAKGGSGFHNVRNFTLQKGTKSNPKKLSEIFPLRLSKSINGGWVGWIPVAAGAGE
jgi:hypothetical protein